MITLSSIFLLLHLSAVLAVSILAIKSIKRSLLNLYQDKNKTSKLVTFVKGLNTKRRLFGILYFVHYLGLRFVVSVLILLTSHVKSFVLWGFVLFI